MFLACRGSAMSGIHIYLSWMRDESVKYKIHSLFFVARNVSRVLSIVGGGDNLSCQLCIVSNKYIYITKHFPHTTEHYFPHPPTLEHFCHLKKNIYFNYTFI
jgi:hypothetical protein